MLAGLALMGYIIVRSVRNFNKLQTINAEKERIGSELRIANRIQMGMLPKIFPPYPDRNDVEIFASLIPAKEVGGDLYDFYIRDEKLFFCIGDVSGKGVPASLVMAVTRALFRTISAHVSEPSLIVNQLNDTIAEDNEANMFVTLFVGVLDLATGKMRYSNAGHDAPLLISADGKNIGLLPVDSNLPVGVMPDWQFSEQEAEIYIGTTIFLYTDGLTEAENIDHDQFGTQRLHQAAQATSEDGQMSPRSIIDHMTNAVHAFVGDAEQSDDLTMMAIHYKPD
jgi:sigma-B regulation protein RsbU (phosphoserine phosphatase)